MKSNKSSFSELFYQRFYQDHSTGVHVPDHPARRSGPVPGLPGQGQVPGRPWTQVKLQGNPVWLDRSCGLDIKWGYANRQWRKCPVYSDVNNLGLKPITHTSWMLTIIITFIICSVFSPPAASWSINTLIYFSIGALVVTVFLMLYCTIPACQRSVTHVPSFLFTLQKRERDTEIHTFKKTLKKFN